RSFARGESGEEIRATLMVQRATEWALGKTDRELAEIIIGPETDYPETFDQKGNRDYGAWLKAVKDCRKRLRERHKALNGALCSENCPPGATITEWRWHT